MRAAQAEADVRTTIDTARLAGKKPFRRHHRHPRLKSTQASNSSLPRAVGVGKYGYGFAPSATVGLHFDDATICRGA